MSPLGRRAVSAKSPSAQKNAMVTALFWLDDVASAAPAIEITRKKNATATKQILIAEALPA